MNETVTPDAKRRGGRRERRDLRTRPDHAMLPTLAGQLPLTEPMDQEQIERIDAASLDILEEVGVVFRDDIALEDWRKAGAVRGERVHLDRGLVKSLIRPSRPRSRFMRATPKRPSPSADGSRSSSR